MTEFKVELPVKLNGVYITEEVHDVLDEMQTSGSLNWSGGPQYDNGGVDSINGYINELNDYFIEVIAVSCTTEPNDKEKAMLSNLHWIRDRVRSLSVPAEFLTPEK